MQGEQSSPTSFKVGILGGGFMATVHTNAVRAAGGHVVAIATSNQASAHNAAQRLGIEHCFSSAVDLIECGAVDSIHICTPNSTHYELSALALSAGLHVVCEKPLAVSAADGAKLAANAAAATTVASVPFIYRYHPMVREARNRVAAGTAGRIFSIHGTYLQDWLWAANSTNWRVSKAAGGPSRAFADIGSHLCDLVEFITDDRIKRLSATTRIAHQHRGDVTVKTEDIVALVFELAGGGIGTLLISQVAAGRKNSLVIELSGEHESFIFDQENPDRLMVGHPGGFDHIARGGSSTSTAAESYSRVPAGHPMGYQDAFNAFITDALAAQAGYPVDGLPTFEDGYRATVITEAVLASAQTRSWVDIPPDRHHGKPQTQQHGEKR